MIRCHRYPFQREEDEGGGAGAERKVRDERVCDEELHQKGESKMKGRGRRVAGCNMCTSWQCLRVPFSCFPIFLFFSLALLTCTHTLPGISLPCQA